MNRGHHGAAIALVLAFWVSGTAWPLDAAHADTGTKCENHEVHDGNYEGVPAFLPSRSVAAFASTILYVHSELHYKYCYNIVYQGGYHKVDWYVPRWFRIRYRVHKYTGTFDINCNAFNGLEVNSFVKAFGLRTIDRIPEFKLPCDEDGFRQSPAYIFGTPEKYWGETYYAAKIKAVLRFRPDEQMRSHYDQLNHNGTG